METEEDIAAFKRHLQEVIEGAAFKGSHRSRQFLEYIVEQSLAGHFESLKERVIGVELFGRPTTYDTSDDAIVRVTASDVRKRLLQHYGQQGGVSEFRIALPLGSYIPEITREARAEANHATAAAAVPAAAHADAIPSPQEAVSSVPTAEPAHSQSTKKGWLYFLCGAVVLNLAIWAMVWNHFSHATPPSASVLPWSVFFHSPRPTQLITSDPNIAEMQGLTHSRISVSDYANRNYIPDPDKLTPEVLQFARVYLRGDKAAAVDTPIAVNIAELAETNARKISVHAARSVRLSDLETDDNFILLGSPRSDPWSALFNDELDFRFVFDQASEQEVIHNTHPRPHESVDYVPTALGWATGESYAIIALVQNPDQNGQVLLLAGANGEGTEAAGRLVTDLPRLSTILQKCGISSSGPLQHFELLLHLHTMAGSPSNIDVAACHILAGNSSK
ncbi:hypothetical protein [Paracidobacterium acidisoli]|uniref:hypothetical protein n=1 Tax=Paracidobacterium acidisoli TaxID=2303751 RepID=UPI0011C16ECE|nr:hypothetical protein [Paracidobacterium acidisoli]MBT9332430.1 hypothetical protein [Paracidobacterium acidisoli]